jgi:hypothetical protein
VKTFEIVTRYVARKTGSKLRRTAFPGQHYRNEDANLDRNELWLESEANHSFSSLAQVNDSVPSSHGWRELRGKTWNAQVNDV